MVSAMLVSCEGSESPNPHRTRFVTKEGSGGGQKGVRRGSEGGQEAPSSPSDEIRDEIVSAPVPCWGCARWRTTAPSSCCSESPPRRLRQLSSRSTARPCASWWCAHAATWNTLARVR
eukprot:1047809-Prorocentrum_minimum.AAC.1